MTNVLLNNNAENSTNIFPTLVNTVSEERNQVIEKHKRALQRKTIEEAEALSLPGSSLLAIPAIEIKSHRETTLALIERIYHLIYIILQSILTLWVLYSQFKLTTVQLSRRSNFQNCGLIGQYYRY